MNPTLFSLTLGLLAAGFAPPPQVTSPAQEPAALPPQSVPASAHLAFADFDGDEKRDVALITAEGGLKLLQNLGQGQFEEVTARCRVGEVRGASFVLWGDYDRDGKVDLLVGALEGPRHLFRNLGDGIFEDVAAELGLAGVGGDRSAQWIDTDGEGRLDLFLEGRDGARLWQALADGTLAESLLAPASPGPIVQWEAVEGADPAAGEDRAVQSADATGLSAPGSTPVGGAVVLGRPSRTPRGIAKGGTPAPVLPSGCAVTLQDALNPGVCLQASSVPMPGMLFPPPHDGGVNNLASGVNSFVGGGQNNVATAGRGLGHTTVGGGLGNAATGNYATVGGGSLNSAWEPNATVGGGSNNSARYYATVAGGQSNSASGANSTVGGGAGNSASGDSATIGGGANNTIEAYESGSTIGGGSHNTAASSATVGGGFSNLASGDGATVGGGSRNVASELSGTVGGGQDNEASGLQATIAGGDRNLALRQWSTVGGGVANSATESSTTVAGGASNTAATFGATVGGGVQNSSSGLHATVAGGQENRASHNEATVGGGSANDASGSQSTVAGGQSNQAGSVASVGGGRSNAASGAGATIGGGIENSASGYFATIPGGLSNAATGFYSFAAGRRAKANHEGSFVWGDSTDEDKTSSDVDQFNVYARRGFNLYSSGGAQLVTNFLSMRGTDPRFVFIDDHPFAHHWELQCNAFAQDAFGVVRYEGSANPLKSLIITSQGNVGVGTPAPAFKLEVNGSAGKPGGGSWSVSSDRRLKKNVHTLDGALDTLLALRGVTFEYKDPAKVHELEGERIGFIAQEVEEVLPDWVDEGENGYKRLTIRGFEALAVEALRELAGELRNERDVLAGENEALVLRVASLEARLGSLETALTRLAASD